MVARNLIIGLLALNAAFYLAMAFIEWNLWWAAALPTLPAVARFLMLLYWLALHFVFYCGARIWRGR